MKLKDIDNLIKSYNKYNKLINSNCKYVIKMDNSIFKSVKDFIKYINNNSCVIIDLNTKVNNASCDILEIIATYYDNYYEKDIDIIYLIHLEVICE